MAKSTGVGRGSNPNSHNVPVIKNNGGKLRAKLTVAQKEELYQKVIEWSFAGISRAEIKQMVITSSPAKINENDAIKIIGHAMLRVSEISRQEASVVIANHVETYEKIYKWFESVDCASGVNKALQAKERLLGLLKKKLTINNKKSTVILREVKYDTSKLSLTEKKRMEQLINKTK